MGQDTGRYFARRFGKKRVAPLPTFSVESSQIDTINGTYQQGHIFNLAQGTVKTNDKIRLRVSDTNRFDLGDVELDDDKIMWAHISSSDDEQDPYVDIIFDDIPTVFTFPVRVWDNQSDNYVELFKIIEQ